ncbi:hypothetical protein H4R24_003706 [Coemansia sp. RSA 988]|nr:hypothetical protein H4R24_003706 [Coemansia sp. RSA 988]
MDQGQTSTDASTGAAHPCKDVSDPLSLDGTRAEQPVPDTAFGWVVVLGSALNMMFSFGIISTFGVYLQHYKLVEFPTASTSLLSWIGTLQYASTCFFGIAVGVLCERMDTRYISLFGSLMTGLGLVVASFCNSPLKLLLTQGLLYGFGASFLYITAITLPSQWFRRYRGLAASIATSGAGMGGLWLPFATDAMITRLGRAWALRITGLLVFGTCGPAALLMRLHGQPAKRDKVFDLAVLRDKRFALLFSAALFGSSGYYIPFYFMPTYSEVVLGKQGGYGANVVAMMNGAGVAGRICMGVLGDRLGSLNMLCVSTLASCLSILVLWLPFSSLSTFLAAAVIFGFFSGAIVSLIPVVTANTFGTKRLPSIISLIMIAYTISALISSPPAGAMLDKYGHGYLFTSTIIYGGVFFAASLVCQCLFRCTLSRIPWAKI